MIPNLTILNKQEGIYASWKSEHKITRIDTIMETSIPINSRYAGLDPGTRHIGIALGTILWEIEMERADTTPMRMIHIWRLLNELIPYAKYLTIEGASYADRYRQVELQDIRCGATCWAMNDSRNIEVQIVPPLTIRKAVFGSAKVKNPWKELGIPDNAAAALGCALYPIMK